MHVIAVANQKGGVGKTTTAMHTAAAIAKAGLPTILIDWDPQGHLSEALGYDDDEMTPPAHLPGLLLGDWEGDLRTLIREVEPNLYVIPSHMDMFILEARMYTLPGREFLLTRLLDALAEAFAVCVIDCPPSLAALTDNALVAARRRPEGDPTIGQVLVPVEAEHSTTKALRLLFGQIRSLEKALNVEVDVAGIVVNDLDTRKGKVVTKTLEQLRQLPNIPLLGIIRDRKEMREGWAHHRTVASYAPGSLADGWYRDLAHTLVGHLGGNWDWGPPRPETGEPADTSAEVAA